MPTYEYICKDCGDRFDHFQSMSSPPIEEHQGCTSKGTNVERVISGGTGLIFKGTGFYLTDYKKSDGKDSSEKKSSDEKKSKKSSKKTNKKKTEGKTS
tara:strand:+ start:1062 stop:1355 length:294 start_codon:yes stop_codon:yes gene_type:complete